MSTLQLTDAEKVSRDVLGILERASRDWRAQAKRLESESIDIRQVHGLLKWESLRTEFVARDADRARLETCASGLDDSIRLLRVFFPDEEFVDEVENEDAEDMADSQK